MLNLADAIHVWSTPGVSEFVSAVSGAIVGSFSAGTIAWSLQRDSFKKERTLRSAEKLETDRAHLLTAFYSCLQAHSDLYKFAESVRDAEQRLVKLSSPLVPNLSSSWAALMPHGVLPEPINFSPEILTILVDQKDSGLVMDLLDLEAAQQDSIKLWAAFGTSRRLLGEKVEVSFRGGQIVTDISAVKLREHYPHLKEMTDLADGIIARTPEQAAHARDTLEKLAIRIEEYTGTKLNLVFPDAGTDHY